MDYDSASISSAMLFGNKEFMEDDLTIRYQITGLSHILAVSGLHVGFVIFIVGSLLKLIIKNRWAYAGLLLPVLIFYAYLCSWTPSVVRAVTMCAILLLADSVSSQYDGLNALSIAGVVNLFIDPLNVFSIGFILSFLVVFTIFSLSPDLLYVFKKRMPNKLASSLSITISAWVGSLPVLLYYFGYLSVYAIFANFLIVPLVGVLFTVIVFSLIFSFIPGGESFFLAIPNLFIKVLNFIIEGISSLKGAILILNSSYLILLLGILAIIIASDYCFIKRKRLYAGVLVFGFLCCLIINTLRGVVL